MAKQIALLKDAVIVAGLMFGLSLAIIAVDRFLLLVGVL